MKKGFTLVELLVIIALIGLLIAIGVPSGIAISNKTKKKMLDTKIETIEKGAIVWGQNNKKEILKKSQGGCFSEDVLTDEKITHCISVSLSDLLNKSVFEEDKLDESGNKVLINPVNNNPLNDCKVEIYIKNNRIYSKYDMSIGKCGYEKIEEEQKEPEISSDNTKPSLYWYPIEYEYRGEKITDLSNLKFLNTEESYEYFKSAVQYKSDYETIDELLETVKDFNAMVSTPVITKFGFSACDISGECVILGTNEELGLDFESSYRGINGNFDEGVVSLISVVLSFESKKNKDFFEKYQTGEGSFIDLEEDAAILNDLCFLSDNSGPILIHKDTYEKYDLENDYITYYPYELEGRYYNYSNGNYPDYLKNLGSDSWLRLRNLLDTSLFRDYLLFDNIDGLIDIHKYILGKDEKGNNIYPTTETLYNEVYGKTTTKLYNDFKMEVNKPENNNYWIYNIMLEFSDSLNKKTKTELKVARHVLGYSILDGKSIDEIPTYLNISGISNVNDLNNYIREKIDWYFSGYNHNVEYCGEASSYVTGLYDVSKDFLVDIPESGWSSSYIGLYVEDNCFFDHYFIPYKITLDKSSYSGGSSGSSSSECNNWVNSCGGEGDPCDNRVESDGNGTCDSNQSDIGCSSCGYW